MWKMEGKLQLVNGGWLKVQLSCAIACMHVLSTVPVGFELNGDVLGFRMVL